MVSKTFIWWIYHLWARFWPYFNFVDFRAYFGPFSLVNRDQQKMADLLRKMASNQKMQENKPTLKFNFTIENRWPVSKFSFWHSHWALLHTLSMLLSHCSVIIYASWVSDCLIVLPTVITDTERHLLKIPFANFLHISMQVVSCINIALFCHQNYGHHQHDNNNKTWECGWRSHSWKSSTTPAHPPSTWRPGWRSPSHLSRTWDPSQGQCWACLCRAPMPRKAWGKMHFCRRTLQELRMLSRSLSVF